ncbi:hypothetical protein M446_0919 [Methylobacterium sp. 4-46]|uniref:AsmA family protein n=1 Tax=unclassified Methylobacterium TaxID=2615210 RepID=UPI000165CA47|nr:MULTISPECIES: AsmA-like C-terminal region-containing protein [Methylobacterium]ACA15468.1 hypothetical protein M446_0919 [Methylobacterium sp. 4-46]WFT81186.1 AsmA-like C-terminal region-containing protein [Methylobacterium nodulans]
MKLRNLSLLLAAAGCLAVGVAASSGTAMIVRSAQERLAAETGRTWTVRGGASLSLWPRVAVVLRDVGTRTDYPGVGTASLDIASLRVTGAPLDLLAGRDLAAIEVERPVLRWPAEWWRAGAPAGAAAAAGAAPDPDPAPDPAREQAGPAGHAGHAGSAGPRPERVRVTGGALLLVKGDTVVASVEDLSAEALARAGGYEVKAGGRTGGGAARCDVSVAPPEEGESAPLTFSCRVPGLGAEPLEGRADAALHGAALTLARLSAQVGAVPFTGAVVVDLTAKPFVRIDLAGGSLDLPAAGGLGDASLDPALLRSFDGRARIRLGALRAGGLSLTEALLDGKLTEGGIEAALTQGGLAGGQVRATLRSDIAREARGSAPPRHALHLDLTQVRSLPLLSAASGFALLDGTAGATIDLKASGSSQAELARSLSGEAAIQVENGRLTGIDIPGVVQSVAQQLSPDPRLRSQDATAFDRISSRFRIADGRATTQDLALAGPLVTARGTGTIDLSARTLAFRIEPRLTRTAARALPKLFDVSLPVLIGGSWDAPQVSVDLGAVLNGQTLSNLGALGSEMLEGGKANPLGGMLESLFGGGGGGGSRAPLRPGPARPGARP